MQNSFSIRQELTFKELLSSMLYFYLTSRRLRLFLLFLIGINLLNMFLGPATTSKSVSILKVSGSLIPVVFVFFIMAVFFFFVCLYFYKRKPYLFKNISYDFTHWGVVRNGARTEFSKPWREITRFKETKAFFLLYAGNIDVHIFQKRMFATTEELNDFRQLLRANIKK